MNINGKILVPIGILLYEESNNIQSVMLIITSAHNMLPRFILIVYIVYQDRAINLDKVTIQPTILPWDLYEQFASRGSTPRRKGFAKTCDGLLAQPCDHTGLYNLWKHETVIIYNKEHVMVKDIKLKLRYSIFLSISFSFRRPLNISL